MGLLTSKITEQLYKRVIKPILFLQKPDNVHERLLYFGQRLQGNQLVRFFLQSLAFKQTRSLEQNIDGLKFANPVGLAAGFDKNAQLVPTIRNLGFGFTTVGSVTNYYCEGNPKPWFYRLPNSKSLVVNVGLANKGTQSVLKRLYKYPSKYFADFPVVISVAKTNSPVASTDQKAIEDYVSSISKLKHQLRASVIEINISCPNAYGGEPFTDATRLEKLLKAVDKQNLSKPVWIKMPINLSWDKFQSLLEVIESHNVQGVVIGNLNKDRVTTELKDNLPDKVRGNLSGKPTEDLSNELIKKTYLAYGEKLVIVGIGGVFSAQDAYRKIRMGASLVGLITGMIFEGPQLVGDINRQLDAYLKKDGFSSISEAIGVDATQED